MTVIKQYNAGTSQWETIVTGVAGPTGATGATGPAGTGAPLTSSATAPVSPSAGDLWFNSTTGATFIYYNSAWVELGGGTMSPYQATSSTRPSSPWTGQHVYETNTNLEYVWNGTAWILVLNPSAVSLDSSNRVSFPANPSVRASRSGDLSYNNSAQNVPIIFNSASTNIGSHYSTSTGLLTAPVAGDYFVSCGVYNAAGTDVNQLWTVINGARGVSIALTSSASGNLAGSGIVRLNATDTFGMAAWFGGAAVTITANSFHTFLHIRYLG